MMEGYWIDKFTKYYHALILRERVDEKRQLNSKSDTIKLLTNLDNGNNKVVST